MSLASFSFIHGISLGIEHIDKDVDECLDRSILIDLFFIRLIFEFDATT